MLAVIIAVSVATASAQQPPAVAEAGPSDLTVCGEDRQVAPTGKADIADFVRRLHGTWELRTRTIQGLTIDTDSRYYFDLGVVDADTARGRALMLDHGNLNVLDPLRGCKACLADAAMGALWDVDITRNSEGDRIAISMAGDYLGSYGDFRKGVRATERAVFVRNHDSFVAGHLISPAGGQGMQDDDWDRIGLDEGVFTYVSCRGGFVDRFVKLSDATPKVNGLDLASAWAREKVAGSLLNPAPVKRALPR